MTYHMEQTFTIWICGLIIGSLVMNGLIVVFDFSLTAIDQDYFGGNFKEIALEPNQTKLLLSFDDEVSTCAGWIPPAKRKVLFVELHRWTDFYGPSKYKTGEYYMSATWDYALQRNGFEIDRVSTNQYYERMDVEEIMQYHRIFVRDPKFHRFYNISSIACKVRPMYFFGDWFYGKNDRNYRFQVPFAEKQILSAHPDDHNTFLGYFPHNLLSYDGIPKAERGKVGLLYGKRPEYFEGYDDVILALLSEGFELHTTCKDTLEKHCPFPVEVIRHENLNPDEFAQLMKKFSFMLGFKNPVGSPSPLVGMSYGVTFLNPLRKSGSDITQHKTLSRLGFPYTYVVDLSNTSQVVQAAEWASRYRFSSYVPPQYRVESLVNRMCIIVEDDSLCLCPNKLFGGQNVTSEAFCS
jgi:hypothetical protein